MLSRLLENAFASQKNSYQLPDKILSRFLFSPQAERNCTFAPRQHHLKIYFPQAEREEGVEETMTYLTMMYLHAYNFRKTNDLTGITYHKKECQLWIKCKIIFQFCCYQILFNLFYLEIFVFPLFGYLVIWQNKSLT